MLVFNPKFNTEKSTKRWDITVSVYPSCYRNIQVFSGKVKVLEAITGVSPTE